MEPARCMICNRPMMDWLEVCGKLCVCQSCASTVTLSDLAGIGFAELKPDTFQMDGETLVTKDEPEETLDVKKAKERFNKEYGKKTFYPVEKALEYSNKDCYMATGDLIEIREKSYDWTIDDIVQYIKDLGFATEKAFDTHCNALIEGGYTASNAYALLLFERYNEETVCDEIGTHYNALEGQAPNEAIKAMLEAESLVTKDWTEDILNAVAGELITD